MNESSVSDFERELRLSPRPTIVTLLVTGVAVGLVADAASEQRLVAFAVVLCALSGIAWALAAWRPLPGQWFVLFALIAVILLATLWLDRPLSLVLFVVPTALAGAMISLFAAGVIIAGETTALLLLASYADGVDASIVIVSLAGIWATLGVMYGVRRQMSLLAGWSWDHYQRASGGLDEARDNQLKLKNTLSDLADANEQLARLNAVAHRLRQAADDARRIKDQFVANVSHELRTPLNMIVGFSEMILQAPGMYGEAIPSVLLADLEVIKRNAEHLSGLVDDVLDLSQVETGKMALTKENVSLHEIVEAASTAVRPLFDSKKLYLSTELPEDLPPLLCDRTRIREVLLNLLSNAGRFTERGGVRVSAWSEGENVVISVADTGVGIAPEDRERVFQPFEQADGSLSRRHGGTGLGLSISKHFVELHGGRIWVEGEKGVGTTVCFRMPLRFPQAARSGAMRWLSDEWAYGERTRPSMAPAPTLQPRLLVLDPEGSLKRLVARYLNDVEIVPVSQVDETLQLISETPYDALLVNHTGTDGIVEQLDSASLPPGMPMMVCSVPGTREAAGDLHVSGYLVKPVSREELLGVLDRLSPRGETVLIVDDEPEAIRLFRRMLTSSGHGYRVLRARDGQMALNILRDNRVDVVLLDLIMPLMAGFQLLETMRADEKLRDIPVVVLTARDPASQPIVSKALTIMRGGGLSMHNLLRYIEEIMRTLSTTPQAGGPELPEASPGQPAYE